MGNKSVKLGKNLVGQDQPVFVICEGGLTNYGDLELAKKQVDAAIAVGADAVKFQVSKAENLISRKVAKRLESELGYDWFERVKSKELSLDKVEELARYVRAKGFEFFASSHDEEYLDLLDKKFNVPVFKVGSGEAHNYEFLKNVGSRGKPVIISFGLQSDDQIKKAVETLQKYGAKDILILHCVTIYPTPYEFVDLQRIERLRKLTGLPVGISDHSVGWHTVLAAVALGACVVEKHLTFDKTDSRSLDNPGALLPEEFKTMVSQIRDIEKSFSISDREKFEVFLAKGKDWAGQSIVAARDIPVGSMLERNMVVFKRPARGGISPTELDRVLGKRAKKLIESDEQIQYEDLE